MAPKLLLAVMVLALTTAISSAWEFPRLGSIGGPVEFVIPKGDETVEDNDNSCAFGFLGDCSNQEPVNDFLDPTVMHRSLMWTRERYISYAAMKKNNIPCSRRGSSYYNCRSGAAVNPYHRGCSAITMCARVW